MIWYPSQRSITICSFAASNKRGSPTITSFMDVAARKSPSRCLRISATFVPKLRLAIVSLSHIVRSALESKASSKQSVPLFKLGIEARIGRTAGNLCVKVRAGQQRCDVFTAMCCEGAKPSVAERLSYYKLVLSQTTDVCLNLPNEGLPTSCVSKISG
jgi:hypothetical protein